MRMQQVLDIANRHEVETSPLVQDYIRLSNNSDVQDIWGECDFPIWMCWYLSVYGCVSPSLYDERLIHRVNAEFRKVLTPLGATADYYYYNSLHNLSDELENGYIFENLIRLGNLSYSEILELSMWTEVKTIADNIRVIIPSAPKLVV